MAIRVTVQPAADLSGFTIEELQGSPTGSFTADGMKAERRLKVPWGERNAICAALMGYGRRVGDEFIIRRPHTMPDYPRAEVVAADWSPFSERVEADATLGNQWASYAWAEIRVQYDTVKSEAENGGSGDEGNAEPFVSEDFEGATEFLSLKGTSLFWDEDQLEPLGEDADPGFLVRGGTWVYTRHKLGGVPQGVFSLIGNVNDSPVTSKTYGFTFPAETLLWQDPKLHHEVDTLGAETWSIECRMGYKPGGWNKFYKPGVTLPVPIYDVLGAQFKPYTPADFSIVVI